jgi:hypothetical protein
MRVSLRRLVVVTVFGAVAFTVFAADALPRRFGPLSVGMSAADFTQLTGVDPAGRCADCLPQQNGGDVAPELVKPLLNSFSTLARFRKDTDALPTIFFYKDKLEFVLLTLAQYHYTTVKAEFERVLGKKFKREVFKKNCIYSGGETLTWSDAATSIVLTEYRDPSGNQLEVKFADRLLLEEAEKLQDVEQAEAVKQLEREGNC